MSRKKRDRIRNSCCNVTFEYLIQDSISASDKHRLHGRASEHLTFIFLHFAHDKIARFRFPEATLRTRFNSFDETPGMPSKDLDKTEAFMDVVDKMLRISKRYLLTSTCTSWAGPTMLGNNFRDQIPQCFVPGNIYIVHSDLSEAKGQDMY